MFILTFTRDSPNRAVPPHIAQSTALYLAKYNFIVQWHRGYVLTPGPLMQVGMVPFFLFLTLFFKHTHTNTNTCTHTGTHTNIHTQTHIHTETRIWSVMFIFPRFCMCTLPLLNHVYWLQAAMSSCANIPNSIATIDVVLRVVQLHQHCGRRAYAPFVMKPLFVLIAN